jgi:hypothetical protein
MFDKYTYKQKFYALIILFIMLLLASYKKTFKHVFSAQNELSLIEERITESNVSDQDLYVLNSQLTDLDLFIRGQNAEPQLVQHEILDFITRSNFKVDVVNIENVHLFKDTDFMIYTNQLEVEGDYIDLMKLLYSIENKFESSRVVSLAFYVKKDFRNKRKRLILKLILQNYEKI